MFHQKIQHHIVLMLLICICVVFFCWPGQAVTIASGQGFDGSDIVDSFYTMKERLAVGVLFRTRAAEYHLATVERDFLDSVVALALSQARRLPLNFSTTGTSISKLSISEKQTGVSQTPIATKTNSTSIKTKITAFRSNAKGGLEVVCDSCPTDKQTWYTLSAATANFDLLVRKIAWAWKLQTAVVLEVSGLTIDNVFAQRE